MNTREMKFTFRSQTARCLGHEIFVPPKTQYPLIISSTLPQHIFPDLPREIILKKENSERKELFQQEKLTYEKLDSTKTTCVPRFYGICEVEGVQALVLSNVGGVALGSKDLVSQPTRPSVDVLQILLTSVLQDLRNSGVYQSDLKLNNFHFDNKNRCIYALDFEYSFLDLGQGWEAEGEKIEEWTVATVSAQVAFILKKYQYESSLYEADHAQWQQNRLALSW